nr:hypothetical protein BaRGS_017492 [Batillaria attramentaria]
MILKNRYLVFVVRWTLSTPSNRIWMILLNLILVDQHQQCLLRRILVILTDGIFVLLSLTEQILLRLMRQALVTD